MKLQKRLLNAIQTYYFNRGRAGSVKWNKEADLDAIAELARKYNYGFEAISGSFWFTYKTRADISRVIQITEKTFPNGVRSLI